jgi:hypothetical protein
MGNGAGGRGSSAGRGSNPEAPGRAGGPDAGRRDSLPAGTVIDVRERSIEVRYPDGMTERVGDGRYEMRDMRGRTIIDRTATPEDLQRLRGFARP